MRIDRLKTFLDSMGGGAWPFLVGGVFVWLIPLTNETSTLLNSLLKLTFQLDFLKGLSVLSRWKFEAITGP